MLDLRNENVPASWLLARLCEEAGICIHDPETNPIEIHAATYDVENGLRVTDEHGRTFRLRPVAESLSELRGLAGRVLVALNVMDMNGDEAKSIVRNLAARVLEGTRCS